MKKLTKRACLLLFAMMFSGAVAAASVAEDEDEAVLFQQWQEGEVVLPSPPVVEKLLPFYVSAATENRFFIDPASVVVMPEGVVRYTMVITTPGGARNVSFEGLRCESREWRLYAVGRLDGSWSSSRAKGWQRVRDVPQNRQHAALYLDYFCPDGIIVGSAAEAVANLRRGGRATSPMGYRW